MSWGVRIFVLYIGFVLLIVAMVVMSMREKVDLVASDYYEQELKFQDKINAAANSQNLDETVTLEVTPSELILRLPEEFIQKEIAGNIHFFRPSDSNLDLKIPLNIDGAGKQIISLTQLKKGVYKMQVSWTVENKEYYKEQILKIN